MTPARGLTTRRQFLERSAAAAALLALPWAAGCGRGEDDRRIVAAAIHPAIGVARVGNSPDAFFFGPEVPGALPRSRGGFKDGAGAVAKQAARFRVYGLDAAGRPVRELTAAEADIEWRVSVANAKPAWYAFATAFDIPDAQPAPRRNVGVGDRSTLVIAPGTRRVRGAGARPVALDGTFLGQRIGLGELMTDGEGRLVVLPGAGRAYSDGSATLTNFAGNDGWADDVCDGPVHATVRLGGRTIEAEPAWVLVTPPNYGPAMSTGLVTLYDAARSMFVASGRLDAGPVSLADDILPVFARLTDMQWVNEGFLQSNGFGSGEDWQSPENIARLADREDDAFRRSLFRRFRNPAYLTSQPDAIPQMYGDGVALPPEDVRQMLTVTPLQYATLGAWAEGRFVDDRRRALAGPPDLESLPVQEQAPALDRAALESCLGGAFHPGIEATWTLRVASVWARPFRLRVRSTEPEVDWGPQLTRESVFADPGPLQGCAPGDLTCWLGVPWHNDGASCRSGYERSISTVLPTFWPARIPNQVLREADYEIVMDRSRPLDERRAAFRERHDWERFIAKPTRPPTLELMVSEWWKLGMVAERPGPGDPAFPTTFKVESYVGFADEPEQEYGADLWVPQQ